MHNALYYGDNLAVLRESIANESVDLIYLDPPFNSNASYNVLFKAPSGEQSAAQIEAFEDTWHWNESAECAFDEVVTGPHSDASIMLKAMRSALGENDMMAYLAMMAVRLIELHRVLKANRVAVSTLRSDCQPSSQGPTRFRRRRDGSNPAIRARSFKYMNTGDRLLTMWIVMGLALPLRPPGGASLVGRP